MFHTYEFSTNVTFVNTVLFQRRDLSGAKFHCKWRICVLLLSGQMKIDKRLDMCESIRVGFKAGLENMMAIAWILNNRCETDMGHVAQESGEVRE